jgi:hypothetical protein
MTIDDRTAAEWILRELDQSLGGPPLSRPQRDALEQHLAESETSRDFADWCARIQRAVEEFRQVEASSSVGPGLNPVTRKRLEMVLQRRLQSTSSAFPQSGRPLG